MNRPVSPADVLNTYTAEFARGLRHCAMTPVGVNLFLMRPAAAKTADEDPLRINRENKKQ